MPTAANIYLEKGNVTAVLSVLYDGYPSHMLHAIAHFFKVGNTDDLANSFCDVYNKAYTAPSNTPTDIQVGIGSDIQWEYHIKFPEFHGNKISLSVISLDPNHKHHGKPCDPTDQLMITGLVNRDEALHSISDALKTLSGRGVELVRPYTLQ